MALKEPTKLLKIKHIAGPPMAIEHIRDGLSAARRDAAVCGWINSAVNLDALTVIVDMDLVYNVRVKTRVVIAMMCAGLNTISDQIDFQLGYTDAADGAGNFIPATPLKRYAAAANKERSLDYDVTFAVPVVLKYADNVRSITMRVQANDAAAEVDLSWQGWVEEDY